MGEKQASGAGGEPVQHTKKSFSQGSAKSQSKSQSKKSSERIVSTNRVENSGDSKSVSSQDLIKPSENEIKRTQEFIRACFQEYYRKEFRNVFIPPPRFTRREFGFIPFFSTFFQRHIRFTTLEELYSFISDKAPMHCYFSTAYYQKPDAPTMKEKEWLGADLIFDLDADHIEGADKMTVEEMLIRVKEEVLKLIDSFLIRDFGFEPDRIHITFSGGRGYHIHIRDEKYITLGSAERREIVAYITGKEVKLEDFKTEVSYKLKEYIGTEKKIVLPSADALGWKGRLTSSILNEVQKVVRMERKEAIKYLMNFDGIGKKGAEKIYELFTDPVYGKANIEKIRRGDLTMFENRIYLNPFLKSFSLEGIKTAEGETDEPVTADVKRLIRLPGTLHGKTGLLVKPLTYPELKEFNPLRDAVVLDRVIDKEVKIKALVKKKFTLAGREFDLSSNERLPVYAAVFAFGRKMAVIDE